MRRRCVVAVLLLAGTAAAARAEVKTRASTYEPA
jgi:hypothetical protein